MARVAFALATAVVAAACTSATPAADPAVPSAPERPIPGGRIVSPIISDIRTMNPILVVDTPSGQVTDLLYDRLIQADPQNGALMPNMARFTQSKDGLTYTFEIDPKAVWSDGRPVVADDWYVAKKLVAMSKLTVRKSLFQDIVGWKEFVDGKAPEISGVKVDASDPKKFTVTVSKVSCPAISDLAKYTMPAHVFGRYAQAGQGDAIDRAPENTAPTVFSGPFRFTEWRRGDQVILTRNDTYWKGAPYLDQYVVKVVADTNVLPAQLKTGELNISQVDAKDLSDMEQQPHLRLHRYPRLGYNYIGWRTDSPSVPALHDKRVRQALAYGLDMDAVIRSVLLGQGTKQVAHHVPVQWAYPDPNTLNQYPYDRAKAEDLLRAAGYTRGGDGIYAKDGKRIGFTLRAAAGNKTTESLAQIAAEQYRAIGVDVKTKFDDFQLLVTQLTGGHPNIEAVIIGWSLGDEPDPYAIWHSSQIPDPGTKRTGYGFTGFKSAELDRAIDQGRNPSDGDCSVAARKKHYATFNRILNDEQPYNFGYSATALLVTSAGLQNIQPAPFSPLGLHGVHEWWLRPSR